MKEKLTHTLPQIKCSESTRKAYDEMSNKSHRTITNILQIQTEEIGNLFRQNGVIFSKKSNIKE